MPIWEYKVISSGKGGFATPALLETFLNQLGKEEWEIIRFQSLPDNPLAFTGLARRSTQRDWTLEDAAAAAARAETEKLRAEFEAKFREGAGSTPAADKPEPGAPATDDGFRKLRDTERDQDPEAEDDVEELSEEEELPTFFEAIRPLMRRNQRGPGLSVGVEHLAKRWQLTEEDVVGALKECGFVVPEDEEAPPAYIEYDGDLYWVNVNRRGELWVNTKEKPRPVFRVAKGTPAEPEAGAEPAAAGEPAQGSGAEQAEGGRKRHGRGGEQHQAEPKPLPAGAELLEAIIPHMRKDRRSDGLSGSLSFLARALRCRPDDLASAFAALGLVPPSDPEAKPAPVEIAGRSWYLDRDQRGGVWINGRKAGAEAPAAEASIPAGEAAGEPGAASGESSAEAAPAAADGDVAPPAADAGTSAAGDAASPLSALRLLLQETKPGSFGGELCNLADKLGKGPEELLGALKSAGLKVPEKPREKPVFVEHAGEVFWINRSPEDELWLNAKASKFGSAKRVRSRSKKPAAEGEPVPEEKPESGDEPEADSNPVI